jgi:transposase
MELPPPVTASDPQLRIANLERELHWADLKIQSLIEEMRQLRIKFLGPKSETLSSLQLELLAEEEPSATRDEVQAEAGREPITQTVAHKRKPHPGRKPLPDKLPRVEEVIPCASCTCTGCGEQTAVIGYDESEVLDVEPAHYFVLVTKREKRACRHCANAAVIAAPLAERIVEKGLASDAIVINTVVAKYCDHLPLYRQSVMIEREAGVEIGRATLDGWVMRVGELLAPVIAAMRRDLLTGSYLQADETTVPVQMHDKRGENHQAYLWQYGKPGGETVFEFCLGRGREGPRQFLAQWEGVLQTDGYQVYDDVGGPKMVRVGCWAHARRKFVDAVKLNPQDAEAVAMVTRMDALFLIDREARQRELTANERLAQRRQYGEEWLAGIHETSLRLSRKVLPKSALGQATTYTLHQWPKLRRCFDYAEVELSNNLAENSMRPVALGRKNWLHVGSPQSGPKVASILSVVESCRRLGVPVKEYLAAILPGLNQRTLSQVANLTPARWAASRG